MQVEWKDYTARDSSGKALELVSVRASVGPFWLTVREDGFWEIDHDILSIKDVT